jgi:lipopolysaccharide O-acetyltransferase
MNISFATIKRYGLWGFIRLIRDILFSRLCFPGVRVIRYPWYVRGSSFIKLGQMFTSGVGIRLDAFGDIKDQIVIGANVQVGDYVHIAAIESVQLGKDVLVASRVFISDHDHGSYIGNNVPHPSEKQILKKLISSPVKIGNNVWLGEGVCVLKGVEIGENSIVGAQSVVTKSIPKNSIAVGIPAKVIRRYNEQLNIWESCE